MRKWLRDIRELKKLTHQEAADLCKISRSYYTHIENGTKTPTVDVAKSIGAALNVKWTNFFDHECSLEEQIKPA